MKRKAPKPKPRYVEVTDRIEIAQLRDIGRTLTSPRWDVRDGKVWAHAGDLKRWREKRSGPDVGAD